MSAELVEFDAVRVRRYLLDAFRGFLNDHPDTDIQRGYLAAMVTVYREAIANKPHAIVDCADALLAQPEVVQ